MTCVPLPVACSSGLQLVQHCKLCLRQPVSSSVGYVLDLTGTEVDFWSVRDHMSIQRAAERLTRLYELVLQCMWRHER